MSMPRAWGRQLGWLAVCASLVWGLATCGRACAAASEAPADSARIKFLQPEFNFGRVFQQEKVTHDYVFENVGKSPLKISNVIPTCSCTVGKAPAKEIAPGAKG